MAKRRYVVIGLGNFGSSAAEALHALGNEVIAVDTRDEPVDRIAPDVTRAAVGDGRDAKVLEKIGARDADGAVVSTGDDITASVLATLALRDLDVKEIYVKVISSDHARVMERLGATETVFPERESARRLGHRIASRAVLNYVELAPGFNMQEMAVPDPWVGKTLRELTLPRTYGVSVVAVHDVLTGEIRAIPDPDAVLKESDTLIVAGEEKSLARCAALR